MPKVPKEGLTAKQFRFCQEYMKDLNGTQAAIRAGYSEDSAGSIGEENLKKPEIQRYIKELKRLAAEYAKLTTEKLIDELVACGFSNLKDFTDENGHLIDLKMIPRKAKAVQSIKVEKFTSNAGDETVTTTVKLADKLKALELLGKHTGLFEKDNEQKKPKTDIKIIVDSQEDKDTLENIK